MAERQVKEPQEMKSFDQLGYVYRDDLSTEKEYVFERVAGKLFPAQFYFAARIAFKYSHTLCTEEIPMRSLTV